LEKETSENFKQMESVESSEIIRNIPKWSKVRGAQGDEEKFIPTLPEPPKASSQRRIAFYKELADIEVLSEYYFGDAGATPSEVGERSFDEALKNLRKSK